MHPLLRLRSLGAVLFLFLILLLVLLVLLRVVFDVLVLGGLDIETERVFVHEADAADR